MISSSSSDDESDKGLKNQTSPPAAKEETERMDTSTPADEKTVVKEEAHSTQTELGSPNSQQDQGGKNSNTQDSDLDECISQEDLLAQLGLSSVKELNKRETVNSAETNLPNGNLDSAEKKPVIPHKTKESIIEFLTVPRLSSVDNKKRTNGETKGGSELLNGDGLRPDSPLSDENDDDLQAKEKLIAHLRSELRNEEAKLLLLKKLHAAQNDVKVNSKLQKENVLEKGPSQLSTSQGNPPAKSSLPLPSKKSQSLPPPPPLKASTVLASSTFHPPRDLQPRLLPKGNSVPVQPSNSSNLKFGGSAAQTLKEFAVQQQTLHQSPHQHPQQHAKLGSSAIADLQNVVTSMNNLIQPTPLYPRTGGQGNPVYSAANQPSPVRPTPVRANNVSNISTSSGYVSFQHHLPGSGHQPSVVSAGGKQAAAKMALRKQLERTLLQIPPPKPPPSEWSFIPSLGSPDFMVLVGLEAVVNVMATKEARGKLAAPLREQVVNPKVCSRCSTNFSPSWRRKLDDGTGLIVCEKCSTVNVKKELKAEHTARLKAAFLKALKQEQEIEQKIKDSPSVGVPSSHHQSQKTSPQPSLAPAPPHHHISHHQPVMHHRHQPVQPALYHHHQPHADSLLFQLQQQHLQQQQQELEAARRQADVRWHPYLSQHRHSASRNPQHHHSYVSDSDRQYLLDMIPSLPTPTLGFGSSRI